MIVLDTEPVWEAMKPSAHPLGKAGLDAQVAERIYPSSITLAELLFGIGILAAGRREDALATTLDGLLEVFGARIQPLASATARVFADLPARTREAARIARRLPMIMSFITYRMGAESCGEGLLPALVPERDARHHLGVA